MPGAQGGTSEESHWSEEAEADANSTMGGGEPGSAVQKCPLKAWEPVAEVPEGPDWSPKAKLPEGPDWTCTASLEEGPDWECTATIGEPDESGAEGSQAEEEEIDGSDAPADDGAEEEEAE
jgi:hypothetical protein